MLEQKNAVWHHGVAARTVFRIAVPAWGTAPADGRGTEADVPCREDFKQLLEASLGGADLARRPLTRAERQQVAAMRRIREALYGSAGLA